MKPNLIIIGCQKCGTSSLHYYLNHHPDISMSEQKELNYFVESLNWQKGIDWYESQLTGTTKIVGESSPSYTMYPNFTGVPQRMHALVPQAKLIYIVRDPVERIVSHYLHQWYRKRNDGTYRQSSTLFDALSDLNSEKAQHYIRTSSYYLQISQYLEYYDISQILVVCLEDLKTSPRETLRKVFQFLEVDDTFYPPQSATVVNTTASKMRHNTFIQLVRANRLIHFLIKIIGRMLPRTVKSWLISVTNPKQPRPELDPDLQKKLQAALRDDIDKFRGLTSLAFEKWSV